MSFTIPVEVNEAMEWLNEPRKLAPWWTVLVAMIAAGLSCGGSPASGAVHPCSGAGRWFPADPTLLRREVTRYLDAATTVTLPGPVVALVVPHAGYAYSGPTAGWAYRQVRGRHYERVVILALSHTSAIDGASVLDVEAYETPLGRIPVDRAAVKALLGAKYFHGVPQLHATEHSDENQLPFLQCALGDFRLVSILVGPVTADPAGQERLRALGETIHPLLDDRTLLVVSSDFTHYGRPYDYTPFRADAARRLRELDGEAASLLLRRDNPAFTDFFERTGATICGRAPLTLMLELLRLAPDSQGVFLHYDRSGQPVDPASYSVGYLALAYCRAVPGAPPAPAPPDWVVPAADRAQLDPGEQRTLLRLARETIAAGLKGRTLDPLSEGAYDITPRLMSAQGAFVTLTEGDQLRGCIGMVESLTPLYQVISTMALKAAFGDPRFRPLTPAELDRIHIEVSALITPDGRVARSPEQPLANVADIRLGKDGLTISKDGARGLLLPQVPGEFGWDRETFLHQLCLKAGLPPDAWPSAQIQRFSAQVFGEEATAAAPRKGP
jgi:AmmeMemoRadiSam system protein B/AmmeMemoRadiSam system protein A